MVKFKTGDIVKVADFESRFYGAIFIADNYEHTPYCPCFTVNGNYIGTNHEDTLTLATGYDAIVKGTVLKEKSSDCTRKILGIVGDVYFISERSDHRKADSCVMSRYEIEKYFEPPTPTEDKGIEVFDKEGKSLGFMKEGKVITN